MWRLPPPDAPRIPRHRLIYEIGRGGMGTVFLAEDQHRRKVAIKTLAALDRARTSEIKELLDEARVLERLTHPHVVKLLEIGRDTTLPYLVMEYVHGEQLSVLVRRIER